MEYSDKTILYIDDESQNLEGFKITFYDIYTIYTAQTAQDALNILKDNEIKIVISDQRMPEMSGLELLAEVNKNYPNIICIILTAYADTQAVIQAVNQGGIYRFLLKPWSEIELKITINNALELYRYRSENKSLLSDLKDKNEKLLKSNSELKLATIALQERELKLKEQNEEYLAINEELTQTIEELAHAKEKAEESDRLKKAFLQNMSHEIRTPLNAILGFSNLLKSDDISREEIDRYSDIILNGGNQLLSIVTDILTISSIDTGQEKINETIFNLNELINDIKIMFSPMAAQKGLSFNLNIENFNNPFVVKTDRTKIQQVLTNLISNSLKYTNNGNIEFGYSKLNSFIEFWVKDTGVGIDKKYHDIIFERFRQVSPEKNIIYGGTGLGLAISKAHVNLLGGKIWVDSNPGEGSTFHFTIPNNCQNNNTPQSTGQTVKNYSNPDLTILIAEDETNNFLFLRELLKPITQKILHAPNGKEAVEIFKNSPQINIILMDIKMPVMDGIQATHLIREINANIPIIAQTAFISLERDITQDNCFNGCITKPINKTKLFAMINELTS